MTTSTASPPRLLRIGTRGSALARVQTDRVVAALAARRPDVAVEPVVVRTAGDVDKTTPLTVIGGQGVFTSGLEEALRRGEIDAAVHSAKDLPPGEAPGLALVAFPERENPADVLVSRHGVGLDRLPASPRVGTSSRRRALQVVLARPDARIVEIRGNLDTRLRRAREGDLDGVVLAAAGLARLGWQGQIAETLPLDRFVPSPGQGALAVEIRSDDEAARALLAPLDDPAVSAAVLAERAFLRAIGAGCLTPVGAYVSADGAGLRLRAMLAGETGGAVEWADERLDATAPEAHAAAIAVAMQERVRRNAVVVSGAAPRAGANGLTGTVRGELAGMRVAVTRAREQARSLTDALAAAGAEPVLCPTIRIADPADWRPLDAALDRLAAADYDWLVVTSANAVDRLRRRLAERGLAPAAVVRARVAAVGPATATALRDAGIGVDLVPARALGAALAAALRDAGIAGARILYLHGDLARDEVPAALAEAGARVDAVEAYRTLPEAELDPAVRGRLQRGEVDLLTFASPSSVRNLVRLLGEDAAARDVPAVCVGPVTAGTARAHGWRTVAVAADASVAGLMAAIRRQAVGGRARRRDGIDREDGAGGGAPESARHSQCEAEEGR